MGWSIAGRWMGMVLASLALWYGSAASADGGPQSHDGAVEFWAGPAVSGSWYAPERSGEGIVLQYLADGSVVAVWFTYPAPGETGEQAWMIAQGGVVDGNVVRFDSVLRPVGGRFGDSFDPATVQRQPWGTLELEFHDCNSARLRYAGPEAFGTGERELVRLTTIAEAGCSGGRQLLASGARALEGLQSRSGAWYVPSRSGEGWMIEELADNRTAVYWFTFTPDGEQAWILGVGTRVGQDVLIDAFFTTRGTHFGEHFNSADVELVPWGRIDFAFTGCSQLTVDYASTDPAYGSATRVGSRLLSLASLPCLEAAPAPAQTAAWAEHTPIPGGKQSELGATVLQDSLYAIGGFGDLRGFKRFDTASGIWTELPDLPDGRDHLAAFAIDGGVYAVGGNSNGQGDASASAFRFDVAQNRWEARPELPPIVASHAALLNGRAYIGDSDGSLYEYDARHRRVRHIEGMQLTSRDHSQVVAFLGEIWMLGGRAAPRTAIYDPASGQWREGPPLNRARGGFAAASLGDRLVVAGGETGGISNLTVVSSVEIYTAADEGWRIAGSMPQAVHGVAGTAHGGRFYAVGGATTGGTDGGATGRLFSMIPQP